MIPPVAAGQQAAEALMTLTVAAYAPDPAAKTTDADGMEVAGLGFRGNTPAKVSGKSDAASDTYTREVVVGGVSRPVIEGGLHLPLDATVPDIGWEYVVTKVSGLADVALLGRRYHVVNVPAKSFATARRLDVVEV